MSELRRTFYLVLAMLGLAASAISAPGRPATAQPAAALPGDADGDGTVNENDRALVAGLVDGSLTPDQVPAAYNADVDGDGAVDVMDLFHVAIFLSKPEAALPTVSTREPGALTPFSATAGGEVLADGGLPVFARGVCWVATNNPATVADNRTRDGAGTGAFSSALALRSDNRLQFYRAYATNMRGTAYGEEMSFLPPASPLQVTITEPTETSVQGQVRARVSVGPEGARVNKVELYLDEVKLSDIIFHPYETTWDTTTCTDGAHVLKAIAYNGVNQAFQAEVPLTVLQGPPRVGANRTGLVFGSALHLAKRLDEQSPLPDTFTTPAQTFLIGNEGGGTLHWTLQYDASWLACTPPSGTGSGTVTVTVDPSGLTPGNTYMATLYLLAAGSTEPPRQIPVVLNTYPATEGNPFGAFEAPLDGSSVSSSIAITGWALDDIGIEQVSLYRDPVSGESGPVYIGDAIFVDGARPDIETEYPYYPRNYRAGWGYTLLTNFLPNGGNGIYTLTAVAKDVEGHYTTLGTKTIYCDNAHSVKPFGAIDIPGQGYTVSGMFTNLGWALTPQPNSIPRDGTTIDVLIDGVSVPAHLYYDVGRSDIATLFPGYANSARAGGLLDYNVMNYRNGIHTIQWAVTDNAGNTDGIGSRYFSINNSSGSLQSTGGEISPRLRAQENRPNEAHPPERPILVRQGWPADRDLSLNPDCNGEIFITMPPGSRVEAHLWPETDNSLRWTRENLAAGCDLADAPTLAPGRNSVQGALLAGDGFRPLPVGASLDEARGIFIWQPGPAFRGSYRFSFLTEAADGKSYRTLVNVEVGE